MKRIKRLFIGLKCSNTSIAVLRMIWGTFSSHDVVRTARMICGTCSSLRCTSDRHIHTLPRQRMIFMCPVDAVIDVFFVFFSYEVPNGVHNMSSCSHRVSFTKLCCNC